MDDTAESHTSKLGVLGFVSQQSFQGNIPLTVMVELTKACNQKCRHCYSVPRANREELSFERIADLFSEMRRAGSLYATLTGGEPGARPELPLVLREATRRKLLIKLNTNGTHFSGEALEELVASNTVEVGLSLYGPDAATHEAVTRVPGSFEKTLATLHHLREERVQVYVRFVLMRGNLEHYQDMVQLAEGMQVRWCATPTIHVRDDGSKEPVSLRPTDEQLYRYYSIPLQRRRPFAVYCPTRAEEFSCGIGRSAAFVSAYGDVLACPQLPQPAGSLREHSFDHIWEHSSLFRKLRRARLEDFRDCRRCAIRQYCSRCAALSLGDGEGLFGASRESCRQAQIREKVANHRPLEAASVETPYTERLKTR